VQFRKLAGEGRLISPEKLQPKPAPMLGQYEIMTDTRPTIELNGELYYLPRTNEEFKRIWPLIQKTVAEKTSEAAREYRKHVKEIGGVRGSNEFDYTNVMPGKRGKAYLKRPAHIRRRQRRRFIMEGSEYERKVMKEKYGIFPYYGLFGKSNNPWRKGEEDPYSEKIDARNRRETTAAGALLE